ncbi:MAG: outer membrane beta-barrel protein [Candidatus Saccharicenans sp.]|uniref:outer membrane beta-barrel protein n=1 Tax=Candidatus Saccharicenans sp. TaxID=2819258 RepID=UPI00404AD914
MLRKIWFLLLVFFVAVSGYAAEVEPGFKLWGGLTLSRYEGLPGYEVGFPETRFQNAWRTNFGIGVGLELGLTGSPLSLVLGVSYLGKGSTLEVYLMDTKTGEYPYQLGTLSHTGLLKLGWGKEVKPYLLAGYELGLILRHRGEDFSSTPVPGEADLKPDTARVDFGLVAGAGLEMKLGQTRPFVELCYFHGLKNLSRATGTLEYYPSIKSRALLLSAGLSFGRK